MPTNIKKLRVGLLLDENQQEIVVERIQELCVEKFITI